jgi:hypothetical protein
VSRRSGDRPPTSASKGTVGLAGLAVGVGQISAL